MTIKPLSSSALPFYCVFFLTCTTSLAQQDPSELLAKRIDSLFSRWNKPTSPGCIIGVAREGELVFSESYGMANLEYDMPIFKQTVFRVASISKQFTAACVLLLEEQEKLSLDDDVRKHLPDFPQYGQPITIRHLIHHTSGIRDFFSLANLAGYRKHDFFTEEQIMDLLTQQKQLNYPPGEDMLYNNSGYFLLAKVIEKVSGQSLRAFAEKHIFKPLGMYRSHFHDNHQMVVKYRASGYKPNEQQEGFELSNSKLNIIGDGGLFKTLEDLVKWDRNFYRNRLPISNFSERMYEAGLLNDSSHTNYAFGLDKGYYRGFETIGHSGAFVGFRAHILRLTEPGLTVICLANLSTVPATQLAYQVADIYLDQHTDRTFPEKMPEPLANLTHMDALSIPTSRLRRYEGKYELSNGLILELLVKQQKQLYIHIIGQTEFALLPEEEDRFYVADAYLHLRFLPGDDHLYNMMLFELNGRVLLARKVKVSYREDIDFLQEYEGKYYSEELGAHYQLKVDKGQLFLRINDKPRKAVGIIRKDKMVFNDSMARFQRNAHGAVQAFTIEAGPVRHLTFLKN